MNRRNFALMLVFGGADVFIIGCGSTNSPTAPGPVPNSGSSSLLSRVQAAGYSAQRAPYGNNGAARIAVRGDVNWNFLVNDQLVAIGAANAPTSDVSTISVPNSARLIVRSA